MNRFNKTAGIRLWGLSFETYKTGVHIPSKSLQLASSKGLTSEGLYDSASLSQLMFLVLSGRKVKSFLLEFWKARKKQALQHPAPPKIKQLQQSKTFQKNSQNWKPAFFWEREAEPGLNKKPPRTLWGIKSLGFTSGVFHVEWGHQHVITVSRVSTVSGD